MSAAEIDDSDLRIVYRLAWNVWQQWDSWRLDFHDLVSDALWGVMKAQETYVEALGPWEPWMMRRAKTYMFNGVRRELNQRKYVDPDATLEQVAPDGPEAVAERREMIQKLVHYVSLYPAFTVEAVLRLDGDTAIGERYGKSLSGIAHARRKFLDDYKLKEQAREMSPILPLQRCIRCSATMNAVKGHKAAVCGRCGWKDDCC